MQSSGAGGGQSPGGNDRKAEGKVQSAQRRTLCAPLKESNPDPSNRRRNRGSPLPVVAGRWPTARPPVGVSKIPGASTLSLAPLNPLHHRLPHLTLRRSHLHLHLHLATFIINCYPLRIVPNQVCSPPVLFQRQAEWAANDQKAEESSHRSTERA